MPRRKRTTWDEALYRELRKQGYSREKAARIAEQEPEAGRDGKDSPGEVDRDRDPGEYREWTIGTGEEQGGSRPWQRTDSGGK